MSSEQKNRIIFCIFIYISSIAFGLCVAYSQQHHSTSPTSSSTSGSSSTEEAGSQNTAETGANSGDAGTGETSAEDTSATTASQTPTTEAKVYKIVIDPGHGGNDTGAYYNSEEGRINEKTVNLKIAKYMKKALEQYDNVEVVLTRTKDKYLSLKERTKFAVEQKADLFISLHNNSLEDAGGYAEGSSICVAMGNYDKKTARASQKLGCNFVYELGKLGLHQNGLLMRSSKSYAYADGSIADYYANIRSPLKHGIAAVIVEHGFLDNKNDFYSYLCSKSQLKKLGEADARAVARYLGLPLKANGKTHKKLSDFKVKICQIRRKGGARKFYRVYYKSK